MTDDAAIVDVLNELLATERQSLARRLVESTVFVSRQAVNDHDLLRRITRACDDNGRRLSEAILRLGGSPGLSCADTGTTDLHYLEIATALPRLVADIEDTVAKYSLAVGRVTADPIASGVVNHILERHRQELGILTERSTNRAAG